MSEQIIELITRYGLETVCLALLINALTAVIKLPVKVLAGKTKNSDRITRFIVFLPFIIGLALTFAYSKWILGSSSPGNEFVTLWLTSSSLSLTIYAVFEKLAPPKNRKEGDKADENAEMEKEVAVTQTETEHREKIILSGKNRNR